MVAVMQVQRAAGAARTTAASLTSRRNLVPSTAISTLPSRSLAKRLRTIVAAVETEKPSPQKNPNKPEIAKVADSIGLPTDEGLFGFKPFPEVWVGRLAMMGFLVSVIEEFFTGKGTLQQIGVTTPNPTVMVAIILAAGGATLFATSQTLVKAQTGKLEPQQAERYKRFLGIQPDAEVNAEADALKRRGDFTSPDDPQAIAEAREQGTPADRFLDLSGQEEEASQAAAELKELEARPSQASAKGPSLSINARSDIVEQSTAQQAEWAYARQVEVTNGRWAMIGFLSCIIVEAATGRGIIGQCILYLKTLNVLGPQSGF